MTRFATPAGSWLFFKYAKTYCKRSWNRRADESGFIAAKTLVMIQDTSTTPINMVKSDSTCVYGFSAGMSPYPTLVMDCTAQ